MSQSQCADQRLWFVVDELDALGAIDGLKDALARLRKFGGRFLGVVPRGNFGHRDRPGGSAPNRPRWVARNVRCLEVQRE